MSDITNEEEAGYLKFIFLGVEASEFIIETNFPENVPINECVEFMAQMLFYVHSGSLTEQNAAAILEVCTKKGHYELGARIIQRWHQYEEDNVPSPSASSPCIPPSALFPKGGLS